MNYKFQKAFGTREIKNVFLGLDPDPLLDTPGNYYFPLPEYLYDNNPWNDLNYLLNKSVLFGSSVELVKRNIENSVPDIDSAYRWDGWSTFSKTEALSSVTWDIFTRSEEVEHPEYIENMYENIGQNIIPYIKENPNTNFYVFFLHIVCYGGIYA